MGNEVDKQVYAELAAERRQHTALKQVIGETLGTAIGMDSSTHPEMIVRGAASKLRDRAPTVDGRPVSDKEADDEPDEAYDEDDWLWKQAYIAAMNAFILRTRQDLDLPRKSIREASAEYADDAVAVYREKTAG